MADKTLKISERYWFRVKPNGRIRSGLYTGMESVHNGNPIIVSKDGTLWSIPIKDLFDSEEEAKKM